MDHCRISPDLQASSSNSKYGYCEPKPLNLGCRIFISHSGRDKEFVRHLHYHLVNTVYRDKTWVFFDEKSLPTAEPISMKNILAEARRCELGILVLSEDFFMNTPNPMLELEALTSSEVRLLPLFFRISVDEFKKKMKCGNEWEKQWKEWLEEDEQRLGAWKYALNYVHGFSGLEKCNLGNSELDYILHIVDEVALIVPPAVSFSEKGVCGMYRICKEVDKMYIRRASKPTSHCQTQVASAFASSLDLVGIYGFAGLGKSTLCRCLRDFYAKDFSDRVFLLDLRSVPDSRQASSQNYSFKGAFMLRMQYLLSQLPDYNNHIQSTDFWQIQNLLGKRIRKDRIFLAIDNIMPDSETLEEAHFYLNCEFARGSKVFITSRSGELLKQVTSNFSAVIEHIPALKVEDARDIFVGEVPKLCQISDVKDAHECVSICAIYPRIKLHDEHENGNKCYHPQIVKSSGASIGHFRRDNVDLKIKLRGFLQSAKAVDKSNAWNTAFQLLDITYAILQEDERNVFLDLALYYKVIGSQLASEQPTYVWLQTVHSHLDKNKLDNILISLEGLSFIVMEKDLHALGGLRPHGLMMDYSMYKIMQGVDTMGFKPRFLLPTNSAYGFLFANASTSNEWPSESNALDSVRSISVSRYHECPDSGAHVLGQLDSINYEGVEVVLHLGNNPGLHEVLLSCNTVAHLRSFIVRVGGGSGLGCAIDECWAMCNGMMAGGQLGWVELEGYIIFSIHSRRPVMDGLGILQPFVHNLQYLGLSHFPAKSINVTAYTNLKELYIHECGGPLIIDVTTCINLEKMTLKCMQKLSDIRGLETLTNLKELYIFDCGGLSIINVTTCINLEKMRLETIGRLRVIHGLGTLTNLKELYIFDCGGLSSINVTTCINLEKMTLMPMGRPMVIPGLETLTKLKELYIFDCGFSLEHECYDLHQS